LLAIGEPHRLQVAVVASGSTAVETREQVLARLETDLRVYLEDRVREMPRIKSRIMVDIADDPAAVIIARARERHADLIAMATHGRSGVNHLLMGSVCERVVRSGVAPVLVLRP
jgi:nucleotide-binding universal stress UspA family protein